MNPKNIISRTRKSLDQIIKRRSKDTIQRKSKDISNVKSKKSQPSPAASREPKPLSRKKKSVELSGGSRNVRNPRKESQQQSASGQLPSRHLRQQFRINLSEVRRPVSPVEFLTPRVKLPSELTAEEREVVKENARLWISAFFEGGIPKIQQEWMQLVRDFENLIFDGEYSVDNFVKADRAKKRYRSVVCWDRTRVILLSLTVDETVEQESESSDRIETMNASDFIHANHVIPRRGSPVPHMPFIMTQASNARTLTDFWRMVWQEEVGIIIMLCNCTEDNKEKSVQYWPPTVSTMKIPSGSPIFNIQTKRSELIENDAIQVCKMHVYFGNEARTIYHFHLLNWPDKGTPESPEQVLKLNKLSTEKQMKMVTAGALPVSSPILVHCSAGIGRSGTYVATSMYVNYLTNLTSPVKQDSLLDMYELVKYIRAQRGQSVQTEEQYFCCYQSVLSFLYNEGLANRQDKQMQRLPKSTETAEIDSHMDDKVTEKLITVYQAIGADQPDDYAAGEVERTALGVDKTAAQTLTRSTDPPAGGGGINKSVHTPRPPYSLKGSQKNVQSPRSLPYCTGIEDQDPQQQQQRRPNPPR